MPNFEFTPEQLQQLNDISGLRKSRKRKEQTTIQKSPESVLDINDTMPDNHTDDNGSATFTLPEHSPEMDDEQYERVIKEGLRQQLGAIYDRARLRANENRNKILSAIDNGTENGSLWERGWASYGKSQMLRRPDALGGDDAYLMQATERALKLLNQKTEKDKRRGDESSGLAREIFDAGTLYDLLTMGFGELAENITATRALKKAAKGEALSPTEQDMITLLRYGELINKYIAQRGGPTTGTKIGGGIAASLPYMAGFAATSGIGSGTAKIAGKALVKNEAKTLLGKGVRKLGEYTMSAAAMTPLQAGTYTNYQERVQGQYEVKEGSEVVKHPVPKYELLYKSAVDSFTDIFTEHIGGELGGGVKKVLGWPVEQLGRRMGVKLSLDKLLPGYSRSKYLADFRNRTLWNSPVDEWLEEVAGGAMSPLLTGEHERWKENLSGENLWTTFLTTSLMGAGFSALELPNVAAYTHKAHVLNTQEKKALSSIENDALRKQVFEAMQKPTIAEQSRALAGINWQAQNVSRIDAAHAADYTRFHMQRQILDGMELGDTQGEQIQETLQSTNKWAYRGTDGKTVSDEIITARHADGKEYIILSGNLDRTGPDGTLFVLDPQTNEPGQIDRSEFESIAQTSLADFSTEQMQIIEQHVETQNRERQQQKNREIAAETGIDVNDGLQANPYSNGDEVVTSDGIRGYITGKQGGSYILQLEDGQFIAAPFHSITGLANQQEESQTDGVPANENGTSSEQTGTSTANETSGNDTSAQLAKMIQIGKDIDKAPQVIPHIADGTDVESGVPLPGTKGVDTAVLPRNALPGIPTPLKSGANKYSKLDAELGGYVSIEDIILRDIALGLKFQWKDSGHRRGLARELGYANNERERRVRFSILSADGITPEEYAEQLYFQYGAGNSAGNGYRWDMDDMDIKNAVLNILSRIHSPKQAYTAAVKLRNGEVHPFEDLSDEDYEQMQAYEKQQAQIREELLYDSAFAEIAAQTTPDQWAEIKNLFIESQEISTENTKFETLAEDNHNKISTQESNDYTETERNATPTAGGNHSETLSRPSRYAATDHAAHRRQPSSGTSAIRHERGLDDLPGISGNLTDQERRIAQETAASIDAAVEQLRTTLKNKQAEYEHEKRGIGTAFNEDKQSALFEQPNAPAASTLFNVPRDFSRPLLHSILQPLQAEIRSLQDDISKFEASRERKIAEAVAAHRAQGTLALAEQHGAEQLPKDEDVLSSISKRPAAIEREYKQYLQEAIRSFPDRIFSILNNNLIKEGFIRDVRRLAKKDATAAVELVAEVNAAAEKYAGKQVITPRHSIHRDLEKMQAEQAQRKAQSTSPQTDMSFLPIEQTRHSKTGAVLYSVKLADRVDRPLFDELKKRAKAHNGYYSSFTRSFLFNTPEEAEAFRGKQEVNHLAPASSADNLQQELFNKEVLAPIESLDPEIYKQYRYYLVRFTDNLGYKTSIVKNEKSKEIFLDKIRKLAEMDIHAAIRLVVDANSEATRIEGHPIFHPQHSIFRELTEKYIEKNATLTPALLKENAALSGSVKDTLSNNSSDRSSDKPAEYGAQNKMVSTERYEELKRQMRAKLGQLNAGFDPEILSIGTQMAAFHVEAGARKFADFARRMFSDLGDAIRPYLKPIYTAAQQMPGMEEYAEHMDTYDYVMRFDLGILAPKSKPKSEMTQEPAQLSATTIEANLQRRLVGRYDTSGVMQKDDHETRNRRIEKNFRKDLTRYSQELAKALGWEHKTDKSGKTVYAQTNIASAGGDGTITLFPADSEYGIYINVPVHPSDYIAGSGYADVWVIEDALGAGRPILYRVCSVEETFLLDSPNSYAPADITVGQMAELAKKELNSYIRRKNAPEIVSPDVSYDTKPNNHENPANDSDRLGTNSPLGNGTIPAGRASANVPRRTEGAAAVDRTQGRTRAGLEESSTGSGERSASSGGVLLRASEAVLPTGRTGTDYDQRGTDGRDNRHVGKNSRNHVIEPGRSIAPYGDVTKIKANFAAIRLVKQLQAENREATVEEKVILEKFTGWGGLSSVFKEDSRFFSELQELLTPEEYEAARASTTTSFYTPPEVVSAVWDMIERVGFTGGSVLEPSAGIGHFFGLMPVRLSAKSDLSGIEKDGISGSILRALYPDATIKIEGYEQQRISNNRYDLIVTNVPFGAFKVHDSFDKDLSSKFDIHDYFIAKSVRKLKPGGLGVFITATSTLDRSTALRNWIVVDGNADFIGAVRLNTSTFKQAAGTETSADIIIVRKRDEAGQSPHAVNMQTTVLEREESYLKNIKHPNRKLSNELASAWMVYNKYYFDHPEYMAGKMKFGFESGMEIRPTEQRCVPVPTIDQARTLALFTAALPADLFSPSSAKVPVASVRSVPDGTKEGGITLIDGNPYIMQFGSAVPVDWNSQKVRGHSKTQVLGGYLSVKQAISDLLDAEQKDLPDIEERRANLNRLYDSFTRRYGILSKNAALNFLHDDVDYPAIAAIENVAESNNLGEKKKYVITKSDIFYRRVIEPIRQQKAENEKDAISLSLYYRNSLDLPYIAKLLHKSQEEVLDALLTQELAYINPVTGLVEERNEYLSGNVRDKLLQAEQANESGAYDANIRALSKIIPLDIPLPLIKISLGSTWVPIDLHERFFQEKFNVNAQITKTEANKYIARITNKGNTVDTSMGVTGAPGSRLALDRMNKTQTYISKQVWDNVIGREKKVKDPDAMAQAALKQTELDETFDQWCKQQDETTTSRLTEIYNTAFNSTVERRIDVSTFDFFPNATQTKKPREHQKIGVLRGLQGPTLLAHEVGTGKTITLISTAMEMRRLGIAKKPCIVVQRSTYEQFVNEIKSLYPAARVLVPSAKDLTASKRQQLFAKIAYNEWDIVVLYHSYLDAIPDDPIRVNQYIDALIQEKVEQLKEVEASNPDNAKRMVYGIKKAIEGLGKKKVITDKSIKDEEKLKIKARTKVLRLLDRRIDETMTFEQLGIDALLVDEAHVYKKLGFSTNLENIKGIDPAASQRAQSLRLKSTYILENNGGKNVVLATGTPISNTMAEMWTFIRYLLPQNVLREYNINTFDAFASNFGSIDESAEFATNGKFKVAQRFSSYSNMPELLAIWKRIAHVVLTEDVLGLREGVGTPRLDGGKPTDRMLDQTPALRKVMGSIRNILEDYEKMTPKEKRENSHIPLVMFGLAKRAAIDVRLINPDLPDEPLSKVNCAISEVLADLQATHNYNGAVAIFCDSYQSRDRRFNVFEDIKRKLVEAGIPAEKIAIIHDYKTDNTRSLLFERINKGNVRVVMGTTEKLGIGVNIQERLHLLVNLDVPIHPMDYMQRVGRIIRQGNMHLQMDLPVRILRLGVKQTLDVTGYQRLKIKETFIRQVMKGDVSSRTLEEPDADGSDTTNFGHMMAALSGSQAALALSLEQNKLRKLRNERDYFKQHQMYVHKTLKELQNILNTTPGVVRDLERKKIELHKNFPDKQVVSVEYGNQKVSNSENYDTLFLSLNKRIENEAEALRVALGRYHAELKTKLLINGKTFDIFIELDKKTLLENDPERIYRSVSFVCQEHPEIKGAAGAKVSNVISEVAEIISGKEYDEEIIKRKRGLEKAQSDFDHLKTQLSETFSKQAQLEETEQRIAVLEKQMSSELAEIEAQREADTNGNVIEIDPDELLDSNESIRFRDNDSGTMSEEPASVKAIEHTLVQLAKRLHAPIDIVHDLDEITDSNPTSRQRKRRAKGYYDPTTGHTVIVVPNITTLADAQRTLLHEVVGHAGLRSLLGKRFGTFLNGVYASLDDNALRQIEHIKSHEQKERFGQTLSEEEARRLAIEEYLARLAEGNLTPSRFAKIIGHIRSLLREVLGLPLRISDRDIAYMLWLSKNRRITARNAAETVAHTTAELRVRQGLYGVPEGVRYRVIFDDPLPENIERYSIEQYIREHHITGSLLGEHQADQFAIRAYGMIDDKGRAIIDALGPDRVKSMRKYLALYDLEKLSDRDGYRRVVDDLMATLPASKKEQIVRSMRKHLEFILSDDYHSPLRRRTMKSERPLPDNFKYAGEYVEELLKKKRMQPKLAPKSDMEPTVIYDKRSWKNRQYLRLVDSTLPVQQLQKEIQRRGGKIDELTDLHKHLNHFTSIAKTAIDKHTKEYIDPILDCIVEIAEQTRMTEREIIDYITAQSSLERQATSIAALSTDSRDAWNEEYARKLVNDFCRRTSEDRRHKLWQAINAANDRVLEVLVEDGMLAPEHHKLIKSYGWEYYVPLRDYDYNFKDDKGNPEAFDATEIYDFLDDVRSPRPLRQVLHEAEGRTNKPRNPVAQMVNIAVGAIIAAKTNRVRQAALRLARNNSQGTDDLFRVDKVWLAKGIGNRWVATTIEPSIEDIEISKAARKEISRLKKELRDALNAHDDDLAIYLENRIDETERLNIVREAGAGTRADIRFDGEGYLDPHLEQQRHMECFVNGVRYMVTFSDPAVANAINQYNRLTIPKWLDDTVGDATRWLAQAFTSRNPAFVAANFLRDVQHAALIHTIDSDGDLRGFIRNIPPSMAAITRHLRGKAAPLTVAESGRLDVLSPTDRERLTERYGNERVIDTLYDYFRDNGGETGFVHSKDITDAEKEIKRYVAFRTGRVAELVKAAQRSERPGIWLSYAARKSGAKAVATALENASKVAENTSRFATFAASLDQGKSLLRAIDDAKNITVNFNRRGTATRPLGMFYVFFNASMQGAAQVARVAYRNRSRFAKVVASLTTAGFLDSLLVDFFLAGGGDDGCDLSISEYEKRNHLIVPFAGRKGYLKIPLPQGFRAFYGIGTLLHDLYQGKVGAEDATRKMLMLLYEDFSPVASPSPKGDPTRVLVPTALTPWYDIWYAGEDAFGYPVSRRSYGTTENYPLSEMGLKNVNKSIYYLCCELNRLGGGDENTPAGLRNNGEIDPLLRGIFEWNPSHVEHVLTYYGGGMGKFVKDVVHTTQAMVTPDESINSRDLPILNRFYGTARPENPTGHYYNLKSRLTNIEAHYKRLGKVLDRHDEDVRRNLQRIAIFKAHQSAVNKLRKILADTHPNTPEYDRLREELNDAMMKALNEDAHVTGN